MTELCLVCQYEADSCIPGSLQALEYRVKPARYRGVSIIFESEIAVCSGHVIYIVDEFPETLREIETDVNS